MTISFQCPSCTAIYKAKQSQAGRKGLCPKCGQRIQIPGDSTSRTVLGRPIDPTVHAAPTTLHPSTTTQPPPLPSPAGQSSAPPLLANKEWRVYVAGAVGVGLVLVTLMACAGTISWLAAGKPKQDQGGGGLTKRQIEKAEDRAQPVGEAEELVAVWIKRNSERPDSVKFKRWGPHVSRAQVADLFRKNGLGKDWDAAMKDPEIDVYVPELRVRVVFEAAGSVAMVGNDGISFLTVIDLGDGIVRLDLIVPVNGKKIPVWMSQDDSVFRGPFWLSNNHGDDWWTPRRKALASRYPSMPD